MAWTIPINYIFFYFLLKLLDSQFLKFLFSPKFIVQVVKEYHPYEIQSRTLLFSNIGCIKKEIVIFIINLCKNRKISIYFRDPILAFKTIYFTFSLQNIKVDDVTMRHIYLYIYLMLSRETGSSRTPSPIKSLGASISQISLSLYRQAFPLI